ncbi:hypothetical protein SAMN02745121_08867 [Nannocystis exedens]|uniref:Uncharacterized protein n=1 Tax=Nannocystis exedens TaxID=54 RepID=A0A1I2INB8_9BACT|nr:hypothetical protein [Nannocystis exedens]SFF43912.1 hypothetical protein SAMN02745121_08867 [Nannocystis exedens]
MKWGLQHVKVTLEERESGETIVIEQSSDGRVTCERGATGKRERAANRSPQRAAKPKAEAPSEEPTKPKNELKRNGDEPPKVKADAKQGIKTRAAPKAESDERKKAEHRLGARKAPRKSLEWEPVKDHGYDGFAARSDAGQFKALITKGSQWALFYELKGTWPQNLGCFRKVERAQKRAQELHDAGWPETEFGPVTAGQIARACPAPRGMDDAEREEAEKMKTTPKPTRAEEKLARKAGPKAEEKPASTSEEKPAASTPEEKPAAPKPEPKGSNKTEAEQDKELMSSFTAELDTVLDEDEDD